MIESHEGGTMITGAEDIGLYRLIVMKHGLKLECMGLPSTPTRSPSCYTLAKREFGFKGNKKKVLAQLTAHIEALKQERVDT